MSLREAVENILEGQKRTLTWLSGEMDKTYTGFKLSLENETIKFSDLKKMLGILNISCSTLFDEKSPKKASYVAEQEPSYKTERDLLKEQVQLLKSTIEDKNKIIELLTNGKHLKS